MATETFVGADGTELSALNANFTKRRGAANLIVVGDRLRISAAGEAVYSYDIAPASADYPVEMNFRKFTSAAFEPGVLARMTTDGNTYYQAYHNGSQVRLRKRIGGTNSFIDGGAVSVPLTNGNDYKLTIDPVGTTIRVLFDDVQIISVTDSSITAAGLAGLYQGTAATPTDSTGDHISSFSADEAGGGVTDTPVAPGVGTITITGYAPAVAQTTDAVDTSLTPGVGSIALTGYAPTIAQTTLGTIVTPVLKNNTGTVLASETGVVVNVYHSTTGALVLQKTGLTSSALGVVTVTDDALEPGTTYAYEVVLSSNGRRLPTAAAA